MPDVPYHYTGAYTELTEALRCLLNASDWLEKPPTGVTLEDAQRQELGNLVAAHARIKNVWLAVDDRIKDLDAGVRLRERSAAAVGEAERLRIVTEADDSHLPPALRREPSPGTAE